MPLPGSLTFRERLVPAVVNMYSESSAARLFLRSAEREKGHPVIITVLRGVGGVVSKTMSWGPSVLSDGSFSSSG